MYAERVIDDAELAKILAKFGAGAAGGKANAL
jgi:hypothetical protein